MRYLNTKRIKDLKNKEIKKGALASGYLNYVERRIETVIGSQDEETILNGLLVSSLLVFAITVNLLAYLVT